jgi:hypothetical protein
MSFSFIQSNPGAKALVFRVSPPHIPFSNLVFRPRHPAARVDVCANLGESDHPLFAPYPNDFPRLALYTIMRPGWQSIILAAVIINGSINGVRFN